MGASVAGTGGVGAPHGAGGVSAGSYGTPSLSGGVGNGGAVSGSTGHSGVGEIDLKILNALSRNPGRFDSGGGDITRAMPVGQWLESAEYVLQASYGDALITLPFKRLHPAIAANLDRSARIFLDSVNPSSWGEFRREMLARFGRSQE